MLCQYYVQGESMALRASFQQHFCIITAIVMQHSSKSTTTSQHHYDSSFDIYKATKPIPYRNYQQGLRQIQLYSKNSEA